MFDDQWDHGVERAPFDEPDARRDGGVPNPFRPISFADRLKEPPRRAEHPHISPQALRPGQMYGYLPYDTDSAMNSTSAYSPIPDAASPLCGPEWTSSFAPLSPPAPFSPGVPLSNLSAPAQPASQTAPAPDSGLPPYLRRRPLSTAHSPGPPSVQTDEAPAGMDVPGAVFCSLDDYLSSPSPEGQAKASRLRGDPRMLKADTSEDERSGGVPAKARSTPSASVQTASDAPGDDLAAATSPARPRRRRADRNLPSPADEAPQRREEPDPQPNSSERPQPDGRPAVEGTAPLPKPAAPAAEALPPMPAFIPHPFEDIQPFDTPNGVPFFSEPDAPDNPAFFTWPDTAAYQQLPSHLQDYAEPIEDEAAAQPADYSGEPYLTDEIAAFFSDASDGQANGAPFARVKQDSGALYWNELAATSAQHYPQSVPPHPSTSAGLDTVPCPPPSRPAKPPVRPWRLAALVAAVGMLLFCGIVGGKIIISLARNEREMKEVREEYRQRAGTDLENNAARVELLPPGQTYQPTSTPVVIQTPTPSPIIQLNRNAGQQASGAQETASATPTLSPRTKASDYPDNRLRNIMDSMRELHAEYPEVIGRLTISNVLDEVVVKRNNTYYLTHNYRGSTADAGAVFVDESCSINNPPENLLLRGQSAIEGKVFAPLWQYETGGHGFVSSAMTATLTTLYEEARYVLFAVIVADSDPRSEGYFNYASHPTFVTDEAMLNYVESARKHSLYNFNVDVAASDRLLTLATLGNGTDSRCLVLIYRMLRPGESLR